MIVRGVDLTYLFAGPDFQLTEAPDNYSMAARMLGNLCPPCDLGLPMSCACPPSSPLGSTPTVPFRLAEPWEQRPLRCSARRSKTSRVYCTEMALHAGPHCSRGRFGQWFIWPLRLH